jgi:hypothetical protein
MTYQIFFENVPEWPYRSTYGMESFDVFRKPITCIIPDNKPHRAAFQLCNLNPNTNRTENPIKTPVKL